MGMVVIPGVALTGQVLDLHLPATALVAVVLPTAFVVLLALHSGIGTGTIVVEQMEVATVMAVGARVPHLLPLRIFLLLRTAPPCEILTYFLAGIITVLESRAVPIEVLFYKLITTQISVPLFTVPVLEQEHPLSLQPLR
jgi:hypothetical protein